MNRPRLRRWLLLLTIVATVFVWNRIFDRHVGQGVQDFLRLQSQYLAGAGAAPSMAEMTGHARREGAREASFWAAIVLATGLTARALVRVPRRQPKAGQAGDGPQRR